MQQSLSIAQCREKYRLLRSRSTISGRIGNKPRRILPSAKLPQVQTVSSGNNVGAPTDLVLESQKHKDRSNVTLTRHHVHQIIFTLSDALQQYHNLSRLKHIHLVLSYTKKKLSAVAQGGQCRSISFVRPAVP